jgi:hypothetical protein
MKPFADLDCDPKRRRAMLAAALQIRSLSRAVPTPCAKAPKARDAKAWAIGPGSRVIELSSAEGAE